MRFLKWLGVGFAVLVLMLAGLLSCVRFGLPKVAPADESLKIASSPRRLARGKYLAEHVAGCMGCHSVEDWRTQGHPVVPGTEFAGGDTIFSAALGLPGTIPPKNLTPYNLKSYSDGELVRVLRTGVRNNGEPLFPLMPYQHIANMSQEDLYSVIVFLRSLPAIKNDVPERQLDFPMNYIVRTIPKDAPPYPTPVDPKDTVAYGHYLVEIGSCSDCHTPVDSRHRPLPGMFLAGGQEFPYFNNKLQRHPGGGVLRVPNITPDADTGIGNWTKSQFLAHFHAWAGKSGEAQKVHLDLDKGDYVILMPYLETSGMTDRDLGAIYDYLRSVPAVRNPVNRFDPPSP
ncbi:MAG TPA: cytochrome C [bacterium]|jgi:mono/diheme cytochrome c family protein|nr:cytochrome C [bacterium]